MEEVFVETPPSSGLSRKLNLAADCDETEIRRLLESLSDGFDDFNAHDQRTQQQAIRLVASFLIYELSPLKEDAELGEILVRGTFSSALDSDAIWLGIVRQYNSVFQGISGDKLNSMKLPILHLTNDILARIGAPAAVDLPTYRAVANGDQSALQEFVAPFRGNIDGKANQLINLIEHCLRRNAFNHHIGKPFDSYFLAGQWELLDRLILEENTNMSRPLMELSMARIANLFQGSLRVVRGFATVSV